MTFWEAIKTITLNPIKFLRTQWDNFWSWIALAHSSSDEASSKRFYGGIGFLSCIVMLYLFAAGVFPAVVWMQISPYWVILLSSSLGLISLAVLEKVTTIISNLKLHKSQVENDEPVTTPKLATDESKI
jgi:hypothetical protein